MLKLILGGIAAAGLLIGGLFSSHQTVQVADNAPSFGAYSPTGGSTYRLGQSIGTSDTTIKLSSFKEPVSNIPYTMSYLNSDIEYGTLSPQSSVSEFISFSGITQNGDGSATLTGVLRGLSRTPGTGGCVASTTLAQSHAGQSILILSNPPCQLAEYAPLRTAATVSAIWTYSALPIFSNLPINPTDGANKAYVDSVAVAGASNADILTKGIVQLATALQIASSTKLGSTGASLGLTASSSTSSPSVLCGLGCIVATQNDGKIHPNFIATSSAYTYNWAASTTYSGRLLAAATTTIAASGTTSAPFILNSVPYAFSATQGASSTILATDGKGSLTWEPQSSGAISTSTTFTTATTNSSGVSAVALCVSPKVVSGGGWTGNNGGVAGSSGSITTQEVRVNGPFGTSGWQVDMLCLATNSGSCNAQTITVYAICVNP